MVAASSLRESTLLGSNHQLVAQKSQRSVLAYPEEILMNVNQWDSVELQVLYTFDWEQLLS